MYRGLRQYWRHLKSGRPGRRFLDYYERRRRHHRPGSWLGNVLTVVAGGALILVGLFLLVSPGPGWATVILGVGLLATRFRAAARLLDWTEPKVRRALRSVRRAWKRPPLRYALTAAMLLVVLVAGCIALARTLD